MNGTNKCTLPVVVKDGDKVHKQWKLELELAGGSVIQIDPALVVTGYRLSNPSPDGFDQFYAVEQGQYGQPLIKVEPSLALPLPENLIYVDGTGKKLDPSKLAKVGGVIAKDTQLRELYRFSLSNARQKGINYGFLPSGSFQINGLEFHLRVALLKDAQRFDNYDIFLSPRRLPTVRVLELADLLDPIYRMDEQP